MTRILSLDDDPEMLNLLRVILVDSGYEFLGTTDEQEALSILRTQSVDLFTQDFMRPSLGGFEFLRQIKCEKDLSSIPVLGISGGARDARAKQLEQVGLDIDRDLDGYLQKGFGLDELLGTIETILKKRGKPLPLILRTTGTISSERIAPSG